MPDTYKNNDYINSMKFTKVKLKHRIGRTQRKHKKDKRLVFQKNRYKMQTCLNR